MHTPSRIASAIAAANFSLSLRKHIVGVSILISLLALMPLVAARADAPDDDYMAVYLVMNQADTLSADGKTSQAHAKYIEAQQALIEFRRNHPGWNDNIVSFRMNYLAGKVAATTAVAVPSTQANETVASAATATPKASAPASKSSVKLLDAGSEPRTVLRLHPAAGDKQAITMTMKVGMDMSTADKPVPAMSMPAIVMGMDVEVKSVSATGDIVYSMVFNDATIAADTNTLPAIAAAMKSGLAGISGMSGTGEMSDRGIVRNVEMKLPANAAPQLSQTITQMKDSISSSATPLPEEAVGPGAKWEYQTRLKSQGMVIDQKLTYELVAVDGDQLTLRSTITQNAANQKISNPAMPTLKMDLNKMTGNGGGTTTLYLGKLMPVSATLDEKTEMVMGMNIGQQKQTMDMKMNINVVIESK